MSRVCMCVHVCACVCMCVHEQREIVTSKANVMSCTIDVFRPHFQVLNLNLNTKTKP